MRIARHVSELIGNTPLVQLNSVVPEGAGRVVAKIEYLNPGGSAKDRIAVKMIDAAEASGELKPGGTIVEPTSGNTGVGLALVAQQRGYKCVFVCPDKVSEDKQNVLRAYGAEVVVCPTAVPPDHPDSYYSVSNRLVEEIDGAWKPDQYSNPMGPASHYETTGPEIWDDTDGTVTHFVAGVGTGGTITGAGRYLKEVSDGRGAGHRRGPGRLGVLGRYGSALPRRRCRRRLLAVGVRPDRARRDHRRLRRRLLRHDPQARPRRGPAGRRFLRHGRGRRARTSPNKAGPDSLVVVLLPDGGRGYMSKVFNDAWMSSYGFLRSRLDGSLEQATVGDVLRGKSGALPDLVHTHPSETVRDAIGILREYGVSQMPVVGAEPPVMAGEVAGSVSERELLSAVFEGRAKLADAVSQHMLPPLPMIGAGELVSHAAKALRDCDAVMVVEEGKPVGVLTRHDLLGFLSDGNHPALAGPITGITVGSAAQIPGAEPCRRRCCRANSQVH